MIPESYLPFSNLVNSYILLSYEPLKNSLQYVVLPTMKVPVKGMQLKKKICFHGVLPPCLTANSRHTFGSNKVPTCYVDTSKDIGGDKECILYPGASST